MPGGGDVEQGKNRTNGFLGIDWALDNNSISINVLCAAGMGQ